MSLLSNASIGRSAGRFRSGDPPPEQRGEISLVARLVGQVAAAPRLWCLILWATASVVIGRSVPFAVKTGAVAIATLKDATTTRTQATSGQFSWPIEF